MRGYGAKFKFIKFRDVPSLIDLLRPIRPLLDIPFDAFTTVQPTVKGIDSQVDGTDDSFRLSAQEGMSRE